MIPRMNKKYGQIFPCHRKFVTKMKFDRFRFQKEKYLCNMLSSPDESSRTLHLMELKRQQNDLYVISHKSFFKFSHFLFRRKRRLLLSKKSELREKTEKEFGIVHVHTLQRSLRLLHEKGKSAKVRNDKILEEMQLALDVHARIQSSESVRTLNRVKASCAAQIERVYPAWQEKVQEKKVAELQTLEGKRQLLYQRRVLAKKTFEKEVALNTLIHQTVRTPDFNLY